MSHTAAARTRSRRTPWPTAAGLVVLTVAIVAATAVHRSASAHSFTEVAPAGQGGAPTRADGILPDGATVFDDHPGVANLDPGLLRALRTAATDAAADSVEFFVNSGWRTPVYQNRLLRDAVAEHGSPEEAARWVATPETSAHVAGHAVDIGRSDARTWLSEHGAEYGLCQIYANEPWHYELRPEAAEHGCPPMYPDPTHDPRMRR